MENHDDDNTQSFVPLTSGTMVSHYKIISKIGAGGMGEVYLAEDSKLKRKVALKFMPVHLAADADMRTRFTREAQAAAKLDHPNIVPVYEVGEHNNRPFFAMAHIEGQSLREVIKQGKLSVSEAIDFTMQICEGLHKAHESGVVHRDVKPGNIIIDKENRPRILDFGLATITGEEKLTKTGSTLGTVGYMAPEQIEGKNIDQRSDLFSVGVILYEMLTGRRPFEGDNDAAVVRAITSSNPEPIARFKSGVTGELQQIINKALTKDPSLRYQHADGMLSDLKRLQIESITSGKKFGLAKILGIVTVFVAVAITIYFAFFTTEEKKSSSPERVAVLPFENMGDSDKDYFVSGITEEITSRLTNIRGLAVIPRGTANRYKDTEKTMRQIGKELNAHYIVDGTIRWQENADSEKRVRIGVHLINVKQDVSIWSKTYDTVITEVFSVQSDIAENVTKQMGIKLNVIERKKVWERYTTNQQAYDFYLQGRKFSGLHGGFGPLRDFQLSAEMHEKAIALDSNFSTAFAALSLAYSMQWDRGNHIDSIKVRALAMVQKVLELKPDWKYGGLVLARYYYHCEDNPQKALEVLNETYRDNLDDLNYLSQSQIFLRQIGNWDEAYKRKQIVLERYPNNIYNMFDQGQNCLYLRKYEEAEMLFDKVIEMQPDFSNVYWRKLRLYINWMGDIDKARDVIYQSYGKVDSTQWQSTLNMYDMWEGNYESSMAEIKSYADDSLAYYLNAGHLYHRMRKPDIMQAYFDSALVHAESYLKNNPDIPKPHYRIGLIYAGLGRKDEAIKEGKKAIELAPYEKDAWNNFAYLDYLLQIYIILDEKEKALKQLEQMLTIQYDFSLPHVLIDPDYTPMLDYPGFDKIVDKYGNKYAKALWQKHLSKAN